MHELTVYSARGNIYAIARPEMAARLVDLPQDPGQAAEFLLANGRELARRILERLPAFPGEARQDRHATDGIILGPFQDRSPFDAIIINTDGSLAERSGNGLTNFARNLDDSGLLDGRARFEMVVHAGAGRQTRTEGQPEAFNGVTGYWLDMGHALFGPDAVEADVGKLIAHNDSSFEIPPLRALVPTWRRSVLVNVGNPHCVTFLEEPETLLSNRQLQSRRFFGPLKQISFRPTDAEREEPPIFRHGVNLQWAQVNLAGDVVQARVFERGEGPTASSGTSATAVAAASRHLGLTTANRLQIIMLGGTAYVELQGGASNMQARFFGVSERLDRELLPSH